MRIVRTLALILAACVVPLVNGCAYMQDRGNDFIDIWSVGSGVGLGASARATHYVQSGFLGTATTVRTLGRNVLPTYGVCGEGGFLGAPIFHYRSASPTDFTSTSRLHVLGCTLMTPEDPDAVARYGDPRSWSFVPDRHEYQEEFDRRLYDIGLSLYLLIGFDFDFNAFEFADFTSGWFNVDIGEDDESMRQMQESEEGPSS